MKALIFNSGIGSRMGELTKNCPKCLLKLKNNENILQFLSFSSKIMDSKFGAIFSKDINRLHYILGDSYQLFIPQNDKI